METILQKWNLKNKFLQVINHKLLILQGVKTINLKKFGLITASQCHFVLAFSCQKTLFIFKAFSSSILASFSCYDKAYVQPLLLIAKSIASNIAAEAET